VKLKIHDVPPTDRDVPLAGHDGKKFLLWARVSRGFLLFPGLVKKGGNLKRIKLKYVRKDICESMPKNSELDG
jgi:hypothetical protein